MVNTKFWSDNFVSELNPLDRYLFLYFLTNEHTNISGIYELPLKTMAFETGIEIDMLKKMIKRLFGKVFYVDGWICIKNFQKHQSSTSLTVKKGIEVEMARVPSKIRVEIDKLYPMDTLSGDIIYLNLNSNLNSNSNSKVETLQSISKSEDIGLVIDAFKEVNQSYSKWFKNKTQRGACDRLIQKNTLDTVLKIILQLPKSNTIKYFPVITTPLQLEDKFSSLHSAWERYKVEKTPKVTEIKKY